MTTKQKQIVQLLLNGGNIVKVGSHYRVRNAQHCVQLKCFLSSIYPLLITYKVLRKSGNMYVLDKNKVRQLHGRNTIKKLYKQQL